MAGWGRGQGWAGWAFRGGYGKLLSEIKYHRRLKSLIAIKLKVSEFLPECAGKMQFYLAVLDDRVREIDENPAIGIIFCRSKDRTG